MLSDVRILDLSRLLPGPACTWFLAGMGAQVDRVESLGTGDPTRYIPPFIDGVGAFFAGVNGGKRSIALDLRHPFAITAIHRLLSRYDVLVEGFKPGVMEAMGLDPLALRAQFPRLIIARISGYGQTGPWRNLPGHDINYVGLTGALAANMHTANGPMIPSVQVADFGAAWAAASGIAAALYSREKTGEGRILDVSLAESALAFVATYLPGWTQEQKDPTPGGEILSGGVPLYGVYRCLDGKFLTVGAVEPKFQAAIAAETGTVEREGLARMFTQKPRDEWVRLLGKECVGPVLSAQEVAELSPFLERGALKRAGQATFVVPPLSTRSLGPAPKLGEHSAQVMSEAGFSDDEVRELRQAGALG